MILGNTAWDVLEQWSPIAFLAAGALFALPAVVFGLNALTGTKIAVSPFVIFAFMVVVFVGLLGLYPRLADRDSTLALGGVGSLAMTAAVFTSTLGVFVLPIGLTSEKVAVLALVMTVAVGSILALTTFGVASLRTGVHSRPIGGFLLVMAASLSFMIVATLVFGDPTPAWVGSVVNGLFAMSLGSIGYVLRTEDIPVKNPESTGDVTAS
jgi:hypothetical protein